MRSFLLTAIRLYQHTLSLDHGPLHALFPQGFCRFYPSCSEYGYRCIARHGTIRGVFLTIWRVLRCHPFSSGGIDEPPEGKMSEASQRGT